MIVYQCVKCGLMFKTKRQVIAHLRNTEKVNDLSIGVYYQAFNVRLTKRYVRGLI